jgi:hypothetical protein
VRGEEPVSSNEVGIEGVVAVLAATIDEQAVSFTVQAGGGVFPAAPFQVKIDNEIMLVGSQDGGVFSGVSRAQEGTPAHSHPVGAAVVLVIGGEAIKEAGGGGSSAALTLLGPFAVLETDVEVTLWTPAVGDVIVDIWLDVVTTFTAPGVKVEVYSDVVDFFLAGSANALAVSGSNEDPSRRWPLQDWDASRITLPTVPSTMLTASPVLADVIGAGPGAGVANIYALVATPT